MKDIFEEYVEKVCSTCKAKCDESNQGIYMIYGEGKSVQCVDYVKDETKIDKYKKHLEVTAKKQKPIMKNLV